MKRFFYGFLLGGFCGAAAYWYFGAPGEQPDLTAAKEGIVRGATQLRDSIKKTVEDLSTETVREELAKTGTVVREKAKAAGAAIADTAADARMTASIKGRLAKEFGVSGLRINVDTTDGLVTLSGTAASHEEVGRAVKLALETEGVVKVISTIQVKEQANPSP